MSENAEDPLGDELRTLFADGRLDLHPTPDARASIVSGARRVRRRRAALTGGGGAAAVVALVAGAVLLNNRPPAEDASPAGTGTALAIESGSPAIAPPEFTSPSFTPVPPPEVQDEPRTDATAEAKDSVTEQVVPSSEPSSEALQSPVLGPDGYRGLKLGMSFSDATATGELAAGKETPPPPEGCGIYELTEGDSAVREVVVSAERGIVTFSASGARTPEGIGAGSSLDQVQQAYPEAESGSATYSTPTGGGGSYVFYVADEQVDSLQLIAPDVPC
ncbi:hypothetical protein [Amycolatopsis palatopharyngis]|uniref:hypothetical protein n=1 Tax=Amycolatopsis palatopharyngis TaxID=187982 RepID=UPI000E264F9A|nr:hypothetical protein [Amycolatopsis palatopharyngis]